MFTSAVFALNPEPESERVTPTVKAVAEVLPSVVNLSTEKMVAETDNNNTDPLEQWNGSVPGRGTHKDYSLGSGCIIEASGYVVTCAHVVYRATRINVTLFDGSRYLARTIASDELNDIALLKIIGLEPDKKLQPVKLALPGDLLLGETVVVVGNPYGLGSTISRGVLSAVGRKIVYQGKILFGDILQTDASVYPGNSGGPLININGEMIGISAAIHRDARGIGFAIPLQRVENTLARWFVPEKYGNVILGFVPANERLADGRIRLFVQEVRPDSPAWKSGLRAGTDIASINGVKYETVPQLYNILANATDNDKFVVAAIDGRKFTFTAEKLTLNDGSMIAGLRLGLGVKALTPELAEALGYPISEGVIVSAPDAAQPEIKRGDLLIQIGDTVIYGVQDIARALLHKNYGDSVPVGVVSFIREGDRNYLYRKVVIIKLR